MTEATEFLLGACAGNMSTRRALKYQLTKLALREPVPSVHFLVIVRMSFAAVFDPPQCLAIGKMGFLPREGEGNCP